MNSEMKVRIIFHVRYNLCFCIGSKMEAIVLEKYNERNNVFKLKSINIEKSDFCRQENDFRIPKQADEGIFSGKNSKKL